MAEETPVPPVASVIEIKNRFNQSVIFACEAASMREAVVNAIKLGVNLRYSDLSNSNLRYSNLRYSDLIYSDLSNSDLRYSNLRYSNLSNSNLSNSNLRYSNLRYSDLSNSDLSNSDLSNSDLSNSNLSNSNLRYSDLSNSNLSSIKVNWGSHSIIAEILRQASGNSVGKRKVAGLILVSPDWCWDQWFRLRKSRYFDWAIDTLAAFVQEGDDAPEMLVKRSIHLKTPAPQS